MFCLKVPTFYPVACYPVVRSPFRASTWWQCGTGSLGKMSLSHVPLPSPTPCPCSPCLSPLPLANVPLPQANTPPWTITSTKDRAKILGSYERSLKALFKKYILATIVTSPATLSAKGKKKSRNNYFKLIFLVKIGFSVPNRILKWSTAQSNNYGQSPKFQISFYSNHFGNQMKIAVSQHQDTALIFGSYKRSLKVLQFCFSATIYKFWLDSNHLGNRL